MTYTSCVRHRANTRFFIKYEDILDLCGGDQTKATAHRVLEARTNARIAALEDQKIPISEENLWLTMSWEDFVDWSLEDREKTSFRRVLPQMISGGYVKRRYVKLDEDGQVLVDKDGAAYAYATYAAAQFDGTVQGLIMPQYLYLYQEVNKRLNTEEEAPKGPGSGESAGDARGGNLESAAPSGDTARGGNLESAAPSGDTARGGNLESGVLQKSIAYPLSKKTGGTRTGRQTPAHLDSPPCANEQAPHAQMSRPPCPNGQEPPDQKSSNKNLVIESGQESGQESMTASRSGADGLVSSFIKKDEDEIWTVEAILNLAAQYLPPLPTHISQQQQASNALQWQEAAQKLYQASYFQIIGQEAAIDHLATLLSYVSDKASPSWWIQELTVKQGKAVRLWHVANNYQQIGLDMIKQSWQRPGASVAEKPPLPAEPDRDPEPTMTPELEASPPVEEEASAEALCRELDLPLRRYVVDQVERMLRFGMCISRNGDGLTYRVERDGVVLAWRLRRGEFFSAAQDLVRIASGQKPLVA